MLDFDTFKEILLTAQRIDKVITGLEKALDIQFGDGILIDTQASLLDLLVRKCEPDSSEESIIYNYAFNNNWGEKPESYYVQTKKYTVESIESLYSYLKALEESVNNES